MVRQPILWEMAGLALCMLLSAQPATGTIIVNGTPQDVRDFAALRQKCERESPAFRALVSTVERSAKVVVVNAGRNNTAIDNFRTGEVDLDDLEAFPNPLRDAGTGAFVFPPSVDPEATTLCQVIAHILFERFFSQFVGGRYTPSHFAALGPEQDIRRDFGQTFRLIDHRGQHTQIVSGYTMDEIKMVETITFRNGGIEGIRYQRVRAIALASCKKKGGPFLFGGADCDACQAQASAFCMDRGSELENFICTDP